jgi:hypothetical protein
VAQEETNVQAGPAMPNLVVRVKDDNTVNHDGKHYDPGDTFDVEAYTAVALVQAGHVDIVGNAAEQNTKASKKK